VESGDERGGDLRGNAVTRLLQMNELERRISCGLAPRGFPARCLDRAIPFCCLRRKMLSAFTLLNSVYYEISFLASFFARVKL